MEQLHLEKDLTKSKTRALEIIDHSHTMLATSIRAFYESDVKASNTVIHTLEKRMNELEVLLEELCIETIAIHQPQARHLRFLVMLIKINNDLERMGDLSLSIASYNIELIEAGIDVDKEFLRELTNETLKIHNLMSQAFDEQDTEKAIQVIKNDRTINALRDNAIKKTLTDYSNKADSSDALYLMIRIIQRLERIGDLCKNIAEDTLYIVDGSIYKH